MTTKEIVKAAKAYVRDSYGISIPQEHSFDIAINAFKEGVELANKHWQEKTRWKSLLTAPPKLPSNPSEEKQVLIKHAKGGYDVKFLVKQSSIDYWLKEGFIFWKEIEL